MAAYVLQAGAEDAEALCVVGSEPLCWSYGALRCAVAGMAAGLLAAGLRPGDRLLLRMGNEVLCPITYLASIWAGIVPVPIAAALTEREVAGMIAQVTPAAVAVSDGLAVPPLDIPVLSTARLGALQQHPPVPPVLGDPERLAYIVFTSGSSGRPRAVCHAHRAVWARRMMWEGWYGLRRDDRVLHAGAFNWTYTMGTGLMDPWAMGAAAFIPAPGTASADLPGLLAAHEITLFAAAPGVYRQMLRGVVPPLPRLRHGLSAGEALPNGTRAAWEATTGTPIHEALGMSECSTYISGSPDRPAPEGTVGYPQPGRRVSVRDDRGAEIRGAPGALCIHRTDAGLMLGYWEDGAPRPLEGEWFGTGDRVVMEAAGAVAYLGRDDDLMNAGGFRVAPLEVERVLGAVAGVREVAVAEIAVTPETHIIAALHVGGEVPAFEQAARRGLARYKRPRAYHGCTALPRSANGKLDRSAVRRVLAAQAGLANRTRVEDQNT